MAYVFQVIEQNIFAQTIFAINHFIKIYHLAIFAIILQPLSRIMTSHVTLHGTLKINACDIICDWATDKSMSNFQFAMVPFYSKIDAMTWQFWVMICCSVHWEAVKISTLYDNEAEDLREFVCCYGHMFTVRKDVGFVRPYTQAIPSCRDQGHGQGHGRYCLRQLAYRAGLHPVHEGAENWTRDLPPAR